MVRPRWHDVLIVVGIVGLLGLGVWALWWNDVRSLFDDGKPGPGSGSATQPSAPSMTGGQT